MTTSSEHSFADFDQHTEHYRQHGHETFAAMRATCPIAYSAHYDGFWVLSRYADVAEAAKHPEVFSSALDLERDPNLRGVMIPARYSDRHSLLEMDGQDWRDIRHLMAPYFTPAAIEPLAPHVTETCDRVLDDVIESGRIDLVLDYAVAVPAIIALELIGIPEEVAHHREYAEPHHEVVFKRPDSPEFPAILARIDAVHRRILSIIADRRREPRDDLLTTLTRGTWRGEPMSDKLVLEVMSQLLSGGFDTTTALIGNAVVYLEHNRADRQRLIDDPSLLPTAVEEFLRYYSPAVGTGRNVIGDYTLSGYEFHPGDRVLMSWTSANRDEAEFGADADTVKIDRSPNRHCAFGLGIHRCLGAGLGRMEAQIMLERLLARIPDYQVVWDEAQQYDLTGHVNGWKQVPARFTPGTRISHP